MILALASLMCTSLTTQEPEDKLGYPRVIIRDVKLDTMVHLKLLDTSTGRIREHRLQGAIVFDNARLKSELTQFVLKRRELYSCPYEGYVGKHDIWLLPRIAVKTDESELAFELCTRGYAYGAGTSPKDYVKYAAFGAKAKTGVFALPKKTQAVLMKKASLEGYKYAKWLKSLPPLPPPIPPG